MATVMGDYGDQSRFHGIIAASSLQHQHQSAPSHSPPPSRRESHGPIPHSHSSSRYPRDAAPARHQLSASPQDRSDFRPSSSSERRQEQQRQEQQRSIAAPSEEAQTEAPSWDARGETAAAAGPQSDSPIGYRDSDQPQGHFHSHHHHSSSGASRFPSPPPSSSASLSSGDARPQQHARTPQSYMASSSSTQDLSGPAPSAVSSSSAHTAIQQPRETGAGTIPSPESDGESQWTTSMSEPHLEHQQHHEQHHHHHHDGSAAATESPPTQTTIRVRDLGHIQSLARADLLTGNGPGILNDPPLQAMKYEISAMPIGDIIEMVAALLTKITTTNDLQHDALNRNATHVRQAQAANNSSSGGGGGSGSSNNNGTGSDSASSGANAETPQHNMSPLASSVLAFHGKNVPAITILSYLSRIHKYCPTTYEVFLSLLVYFDRMTERVNELVMKSEEARRMSVSAGLPPQLPQLSAPAQAVVDVDPDTAMRDAESDDSDEMDSDLADDDDDDEVDEDDDHDDDGVEAVADESASRDNKSRTTVPSSIAPRDSSGGGTAGGAAVRANVPPATSAAAAQATYFVVDSFNIHRLIIAGVTCASKFFSDVFYTNSRYAKVGGLPLAELNHLELQFLLLNDFRLAVPVEDLEAYATMLVEFYAREVVAQRSRPVVAMD